MSGWLADLATVGSVVIVDLALAGDNALVVGTIAAGVPVGQRRQVLLAGIALALACRVFFALIAVQLLAIVGLLLAGGLLLLWVAWKMWRELRPAASARDRRAARACGAIRTRRAAIVQIVAADISMSLDNVLAVAGTARHHAWILAFGLLLSIALMGLAAGLVARVISSHPMFDYLGIAIVALVALTMIYEGGHQVLAAR
jgi:YjbE family integral membrane protein